MKPPTGGPVDNPALDIIATRTADDGTVAGLQIAGTLKSPRVTIFAEPPMSQNRALHYIVMGRPPGEGTGADGNLLWAICRWDSVGRTTRGLAR